MQPDNATALPWEGQPCLGWGYHDRVGHNRTVGQFWAGPTPDTVWCQVPAVDGDERHAALPEERHLLPIGGPAFYGFKANLDKEAALAARRDQRPYSHNAYGGHDYNEADRLLGLPPGPEPETYGSSPYADDAPLTADEAAAARRRRPIPLSETAPAGPTEESTKKTRVEGVLADECARPRGPPAARESRGVLCALCCALGPGGDRGARADP